MDHWGRRQQILRLLAVRRATVGHWHIRWRTRRLLPKKYEQEKLDGNKLVHSTPNLISTDIVLPRDKINEKVCRVDLENGVLQQTAQKFLVAGNGSLISRGSRNRSVQPLPYGVQSHVALMMRGGCPEPGAAIPLSENRDLYCEETKVERTSTSRENVLSILCRCRNVVVKAKRC